MAAPTIGLRARFIPRLGASVDRTHTLATGLEFAWGPAFGAADLANGYPVTPVGTQTPGAALMGRADTTTSAAVNGWRIQALSDAPFLGNITLAFVGRLTNPAGGGIILSKCNSNGGSQNPFDLQLSNATNAGAPQLVRAGSTTDGWRMPTAFTANADNVFLCTSVGVASGPTGWNNGVRMGSATRYATGTGTATGNSKPIGVNIRDDGATGNQITTFVAGWSRILTDAEIREFSRDPFCFLKV